MAAAPAHYIRTIHSSFSAAHPHSAAWAATSASSQYLNQFNHNHNHSSPANHSNIISQGPRPHHHQHGGYPSISTHNTHMYTHHLRDLTHGAPAGAVGNGNGHQHRQQAQAGTGMQAQSPYAPHGPRKPSAADAPRSSSGGSRRRAVSIRMPPTYKFDPFADEPAAAASESQSDAGPTHTHTPAAPYTIHIPPAAASDIQLYTPARPRPRPIATALSPRAASFTPARSTSPTPTPTPSSNPPRASTPTPAHAPTPAPLSRAPPPNLSKVVASILLNRVHAVGKPMRRRMAMHAQGQGRDYVKSCLSSVVSVEA